MHEYEQSTRCDTNLVVVVPLFLTYHQQSLGDNTYCLLYTSDAADE